MKIFRKIIATIAAQKSNVTNVIDFLCVSRKRSLNTIHAILNIRHGVGDLNNILSKFRGHSRSTMPDLKRVSKTCFKSQPQFLRISRNASEFFVRPYKITIGVTPIIFSGKHDIIDHTIFFLNSWPPVF